MGVVCETKSDSELQLHRMNLLGKFGVGSKVPHNQTSYLPDVILHISFTKPSAVFAV